MAELTCPSCGSPNPVANPQCDLCHHVFGTEPPKRATRTASVRHNGRVLAVLADGDGVVLGRMSANPEVRAALRPYDLVSREHARVEFRGDRIEVRDVGSKHGTRVGDAPVGVDPAAFDLPVTVLLGPEVVVDVDCDP